MLRYPNGGIVTVSFSPKATCERTMSDYLEKDNRKIKIKTEGDLLEGGSIRREVSCGSELLRKSAQALSRVCRGKKSAMIIPEHF